MAAAAALTVSAGAAAAASISGQVYDPAAGAPARGIALRIVYDEGDPEAGQAVPEDRLGPGQQDQVTGNDGRYRFDVEGGRLYRIVLDPAATPFAAPSVTVPPRPGAAPLGDVVPDPTPAGPDEEGADRSYYLRFDLPGDADEVGNNHIAVDRLGGVVSMGKRADRPRASTGDVVAYTVTVVNRSARDLTAAAGRPVYISDAPARGLDYARGRATATVRAGGATTRLSAASGDFDDDFEQPRARRLIRFGPFDVPAGATLTLEYLVTVGLDTRPGQYTNRAVLVDGGGVELSEPARAQVEIVPDRDFDLGVVIGRIFCDADEDGRYDSGERGAAGARIYIETGSYATADPSGFYHLANVGGGTHVVKVDEGSLGGGEVIGEAARLIRLSDGLSAKVDVAVRCNQVSVRGNDPRVTVRRAGARGDVGTGGDAREGPETLHGSVAGALSLSLNGVEVALPRAELAVSGQGAARSFAARVDLPGGAPATSWDVTIERIDSDPGGHPVWAPVRTITGDGPVPRAIEWDGTGDGGTPVTGTEPRAWTGLYFAQLTVAGEGDVRAHSKRVAFAYRPRRGGDRIEVWKGRLFRGPAAKPTPTAALREKIAAVVASLGPDATVAVRVHGDGTGDPLIAIARTQQEAELVARLLAEAGVAGAIEARGRGDADPLDRSGTAAARRKNRRVEIEITAPSVAPPQVPDRVEGAAEVLVDGEPVEVAGDGSFETAAPDGPATVSMTAADGRSAVVEIEHGGAATDDEPGEDGAASAPAGDVSVEVRGDLAAGELRAGEATLSPLLLHVDARLASGSGEAVPAVALAEGGDALVSPLDFMLSAPQGLEVGSWRLVVSDGGEEVHAVTGNGALPASARWDGTAAGMLRLEEGTRYRYRLEITAADGSGAFSPPRYFTVGAGPAPVARARFAGRLFIRGTRLSAALRNHLSLLKRTIARRPDDERYVFIVENTPSANLAASEAGLEGAARKVALETYLERLGFDGDRYALSFTDASGRRGSFDVRVAGEPPPPAPARAVTVAGQRVEIAGDAFETVVTAPGGETIVVEVVGEGGREARYLVAVPEAAAAPAQEPEPAPEPEPAVVSAAARDFAVTLPPAGAVLGQRDLTVTGTARPGNRIFVGAGTMKEVKVGDDGRFAAVVELEAGDNEVLVQSVDPAGNAAQLAYPVRVATRRLFLVGIAEGIVATSYTERGWFADTAGLAGMAETTTTDVGPLRLHGRVAAYVKGRIPGGKLGDSIELTGHVDTAKSSDSGAFFEDVTNPDRGFPVYGDTSDEVSDVNSRGKVYLRAEADDWNASVGSVQTDLEGGDLFRYDRTVQGGEVRVRTDIRDKIDLEVDAFAAGGNGEVSRDVNLFRATGGTLYYLRHGYVLEGSERVRVIVRDRDNGTVVSERVLVLNRDYTVDYGGGRILLIQPLASVSRSGWLLDDLEGSTAPDMGNAVYLEVGYEHDDPNDYGEQTYGAYAQYATDALRIGAGFAGEARDGENYFLGGGYMAWRIEPRTAVSWEVAGSTGLDAPNRFSPDGGLSFTNLNGVGFTSGGRTNAWKVALEHTLGDFVDKPWAERLKLTAFVQDIGRAYFAGGTIAEQGRRKSRVQIDYEISERDEVRVRYDTEVAEVPRIGPTEADVVANPEPFELDERAVWRATAQWTREAGRLRYSAEAGARGLSSQAARADGTAQIDTTRLGGAFGTAWRVDPFITLRAAQLALFRVEGSADPILDPIDPEAPAMRAGDALGGLTTNLGIDFDMPIDAVVSADWYQRWNGDNAGQIGLRTSLSETGSMYVRERVRTEAGRPIATTIVGAEDEIEGIAGSRTYGEYRLDHGASAPRNRAVLGLGHRWEASPGLRLTFGYEHQQIFGGFLTDGTPIGDNRRDVLYTGGEYTASERFKVAASIEGRFDQGLDGDAAARDLAVHDPRFPEARVFPEHGGIGPGAPLILAVGDRVQLVTGAGADWKMTGDHTGFARLRYSRTEADVLDRDFTQARYARFSAGWVYRPLDHDWLNVLTRYSFIRDMRPHAGPDDGLDTESHALAVVPLADLPWNLTVSGKLAFKRTGGTRTVAGAGPDGEDAGEISAETDAVLWLVRLGYRFYGAWDATGEVRGLHLFAPTTDETKTGALLEIGYRIYRGVRLGAGYNLSRFSDDELGDLQRDSHGFFMRVTGHY